MKIRIKFAKQGTMKFIGHLDVMRYFQKAMRRADVDIRYSEGFSPHQIMSFAAPLGVGITSDGEYLDIEVVPPEEGSRLTGFEVKGHSGLASQGEDILCAAVTSAVRLTECAVNDVLGLEAAVKVREQDASISLKLPNGLGQTNESTCQTLLTALMVHMTSLHEEYPDYVLVLEED
mgnify:CR=1 FL=1